MAGRGRPRKDTIDSATIYRLGRETGKMIGKHEIDQRIIEWARIVTQEVAYHSPAAFRQVDLSWLCDPPTSEKGGRG